MKQTNKDTNKHDVKAQQMNERFNLIKMKTIFKI